MNAHLYLILKCWHHCLKRSQQSWSLDITARHLQVVMGKMLDDFQKFTYTQVVDMKDHSLNKYLLIAFFNGILYLGTLGNLHTNFFKIPITQMRRALEAGAYLVQLILPSNVQAVVMGWVVIFWNIEQVRYLGGYFWVSSR